MNVEVTKLPGLCKELQAVPRINQKIMHTINHSILTKEVDK